LRLAFLPRVLAMRARASLSISFSSSSMSAQAEGWQGRHRRFGPKNVIQARGTGDQEVTQGQHTDVRPLPDAHAGRCNLRMQFGLP
jgi:hypothetical protein